MKNKLLNKKSNITKPLGLLEKILFLTFIIQILMLCYFNLKTLSSHMGYDSAWAYLRPALMWKEKTFISRSWYEQTNIMLDSPMPLAALFYGILGNIFVSCGMANIIVVLCIITCMYGILSQLGFNLCSKLVAINLIVCPYLTQGFNVANDIAYFSSILVGPCWYSVRILTMMIIIYEFIYIKNNNHINWSGYLSFFLCMLSACVTSIYMFLMIILPYIVYEIELVFIKNDWKQLRKKESIYIYFCSFSALIGIILNKICGYYSIAQDRTWTYLEKIYTNIGSVLQGFMKLISVLPHTNNDVKIFSANTLRIIPPLIIFLIIVISIGSAIKKAQQSIQEKNGILLFLLNIIAIQFISFSLFNATYGAALFEERYLLGMYMVVIMIVAYYVNQIKMNKIFSQAVLTGLTAAIISNNVISDINYINTTNTSWQMDDIVSVVQSEDAGCIYFYGDEVRLVGRNMRAYDLNHVYKTINSDGTYYHWGDYSYYDNNSDYTGKTLLIIPKDQENIVPLDIIGQFEFVKNLDFVSIYRCDHNPVMVQQ